MTNRINWRPIAGTIGFLILLIALWRFRMLVGYMLFAVVLSFVGRPIVLLAQRIQIRKKALPSSFGAALALSIMISLSYALIQLFAPLFSEQAAAIQALDPEQARQLFGRVTQWLDEDLYRVDLSGSGLRNSEFLLNQIQSLVQLEGVGSLFGGLIARLGDGFIAIFSFPCRSVLSMVLCSLVIILFRISVMLSCVHLPSMWLFVSVALAVQHSHLSVLVLGSFLCVSM